MKKLFAILLAAMLTSAFSSVAFALTISSDDMDKKYSSEIKSYSLGESDDDYENRWNDFCLPALKGEKENTGVLDSKNIIRQIEDSEKGRIKSNIIATPNVNKSVFEALSQNYKTSVLFSGDKYYWVFGGGKDITSQKMQYNLGLKFTSPYAFRYRRMLADSKAKLECINFYDDIKLPFEGELTVETKLCSGELAYIYTYNKDKFKAEVVVEGIEVSANGKVSFNLTSTKDLFITNKPLDKSNILEHEALV